MTIQFIIVIATRWLTARIAYLIVFTYHYIQFLNLHILHALQHFFAVPQSYMRVGTLRVATIYLQLIQNRYMFRSFTVLQGSHQHCVQPVASDVEVVGYL